MVYCAPPPTAHTPTPPPPPPHWFGGHYLWTDLLNMAFALGQRLNLPPPPIDHPKQGRKGGKRQLVGVPRLPHLMPPSLFYGIVVTCAPLIPAHETICPPYMATHFFLCALLLPCAPLHLCHWDTPQKKEELAHTPASSRRSASVPVNLDPVPHHRQASQLGTTRLPATFLPGFVPLPLPFSVVSKLPALPMGLGVMPLALASLFSWQDRTIMS